MEPRQLVVVFHIPTGDIPADMVMRELCEEFRAWIGKHLDITVSAGIGDVTDNIQSIAAACRKAQDSAARKAAVGTNAVIDGALIGALLKRAGGDNYYFPAVQELAQSFRIDGSLWRGKLARMLADMRDAVVTRQGAAMFAIHLADHLERELGAQYPELMGLWQAGFRRRFVDISEEIETVDELEERLPHVLGLLEAEVEREREGRKNHSIAVRVKHYLDEHYADPDLSLLSVSDRFGLQSTALSHLFKNEIGVKFIDYILKLRLDHAKRLLIESDEPIQAIAEKVGYTHVISFHRAFKKGLALPPGEYRMLHRPMR